MEEYIYTLRGKLDEEYAEFASDAEKTKLKDMLTKAEDWLYDEGFDSIKAKYIAKYEELASLGNVIRGRYLAKEEEKKQALRAKQEASQMAELAAKLAEQRKAEAAAKEEKDAEGDVELDWLSSQMKKRKYKRKTRGTNYGLNYTSKFLLAIKYFSKNLIIFD